MGNITNDLGLLYKGLGKKSLALLKKNPHKIDKVVGRFLRCKNYYNVSNTGLTIFGCKVFPAWKGIMTRRLFFTYSFSDK